MFAVIVGSGFAGLAMAIALKKANIHDFVVLEKAGSIGGTWRDNVYPGCACDIPSHLYSFSFEPNPRWSATYSPQPEIRAYIEHCADKYDLRKHIQLNTEATGAVLHEKSGSWTVNTSDGKSLTARAVVGGLGPLHRFSFPNILGRETFQGKMFHSAGWDSSFDPAGKRIAVIGTGASAIQFVPELQKSAGRIHLFQRTAPWVLPRFEKNYTDFDKALFEKLPFAQRAFREFIFWTLEARGYGFVKNPNFLKFMQRFAVRHIERSVKDPVLRAKLIPNYRMGCKRILMSNTYYPALSQPNVEVITDGIQKITPTGVVAGDGMERAVDAVIFGTGFDVHDYLGHLNVKGLGGADLGELWAREGAQAHMGTEINGFPNFYLLVGPNTGLGHNSMIYMIEAQVNHVLQCLLHVADRPNSLLNVRSDVQRSYNDELQARLRNTVWQTGCSSWYLDSQGRNTTLWPGYCFQFQSITRRFQPSDYEMISPS
ncbi:MAG: NAD(P)/FAD-dependent oxidoreductase [Polyangiaceae bacterium]|nr:NAD(P)/FAD-dependent oxidoreductase [Polyangiaceae bacterium]